MSEPGFQPFDQTLESTERADYLDTQTLSGGEGYFHTENADTHRTDGKAKGQSEPTALVQASTTTGTATTASADDYETRTNADLTREAKSRGLEIPKRANKAQLVALLRGQ